MCKSCNSRYAIFLHSPVTSSQFLTSPTTFSYTLIITTSISVCRWLKKNDLPAGQRRPLSLPGYSSLPWPSRRHHSYREDTIITRPAFQRQALAVQCQNALYTGFCTIQTRRRVSGRYAVSHCHTVSIKICHRSGYALCYSNRFVPLSLSFSLCVSRACSHLHQLHFRCRGYYWPIPVAVRFLVSAAARFKGTSVRSRRGHVCFSWLFCFVRSLSRADQSSRGVLLTVMCITECDNEASIMRRFWPSKGGCAKKKNWILIVWHVVRGKCIDRMPCEERTAITLFWIQSVTTSEPLVYLFIFNVTTRLMYYTICRNGQIVVGLVGAERSDGSAVSKCWTGKYFEGIGRRIIWGKKLGFVSKDWGKTWTSFRIASI
jgi:hypothetical protein